MQLGPSMHRGPLEDAHGFRLAEVVGVLFSVTGASSNIGWLPAEPLIAIVRGVADVNVKFSIMPA